ncbi:MAG: tetratricopeptide repeat protein, partial [Muribaculaceae bacterium]|nr:tetratricopeptide repeat protein [Muribaculaceae bacterium]
MNKLKLILLVVIFSLPIVSFAEDVEFKIQYAVQQMDNGKIDESKSILEDILLKDPKHYVANYEMAYLLNMTGRYDEALKYLDKIKKSKERTDQYYQLLGIVYDYMGDPAKSIKAFKDGLKKFPKSGPLHVELGMMYQKAEDNEKALECYENGILADPMFPSNYLRAALLLMTSSEPVWALMYGEIFMNLEPDTQRA